MKSKLLIIACTALCGCVGNPSLPSDISSPIHEYASWQAKGKLAIRAKDPESLGLKKSNYTLSFNWQQKADEYEINLTGSLGFGRARIKTQAVIQTNHAEQSNTANKAGDRIAELQVQLFRGDRLIDQSPQASTLFKRQTGVELPVESLRYWLQGLPAPHAGIAVFLHPKLSTNPATKLTTNKDTPFAIVGFKQDGWTVNYIGYHSVNTILLPKKIKAYNKQFQIVLAVKHWQLP